MNRPPIGNISPSWGFLFKIKAWSFLISFSILTALIIYKPLYALTTDLFKGEEVIFIFEDHLKTSAIEAAKQYPAIKRDLENILKWPVDFRPGIMLLENDSFLKMMGNDFMAAFALCDRDLIIIDYSKMKMTAFTLEATIKHELSHLVLHRNIKKGLLPRWLDEGVAQVVSGGLADIIMEKESVLDNAILTNGFIPLNELEETFPQKVKDISLAYEQSRSIIEYIIAEYGWNKMLQLLECLKNGNNMDDAVLKTFSISLIHLERNWKNSLTRKAAFIRLITSNLYLLLFFISALILIYGFIKTILKKRAYDKIETEDEDMPP